MSDKYRLIKKKRVEPPQAPRTPAASSVRPSESRAQSVPNILSNSVAPAKDRASSSYPTPSDNAHKASVGSDTFELHAKRMPALNFGAALPLELQAVPDPDSDEEEEGSASESEGHEESNYEKDRSSSDEEDDDEGSVASDSEVEVLSGKGRVNKEIKADDKTLKAKFSRKGKTMAKSKSFAADPKGQLSVKVKAASIKIEDGAPMAVKQEDEAEPAVLAHWKNLIHTHALKSLTSLCGLKEAQDAAHIVP
ncbi:hypothetical protein FRC08_007408 [Ceratobasidium sp. 394]|nr:hypothetical protein FRC08_007408 [Ceratobasidium sp. 394]